MHLSLVLPRVSRQGERLAAHAARVPPFPHVDEQVLRQVELEPEGPPAVGARVRLLVVRVQLVVPRQGKVVPEHAAALGALEGLLSRVDPLVLDQVLFLPEAPVARRAGEGPVTRVRPLVLRQIAPLLACIWAVSALPFSVLRQLRMGV